ncbi:hypothetical protein [Sphingomonas sp. Leaf4]|uniref:hypothetical protein n=1 Tax=Sphingomonas sp. Leaf4 TaxID=2876553 RepID=UPI001E4E73C9|nr:hypothetical protein [Sphingomonas sp. Leaf4]
MIARLWATAGAVLPVAAAMGQDKGATVRVSAPVIWAFLGYPFEAGSMIAALCACVAVRFYVTQSDRKAHRWSVDIPVSALTLLFTAGMVISQRPEPLWALMMGTGIGALGAGIIKIALTWVQRVSGPLAPPQE